MLKVREIMTPNVYTLAPETTLRNAVSLFTERHVGGAPVVTGGRVVGAVSMTDILDLQADGVAEPRDCDTQIEQGNAADDELSSWSGDDDPPASYFAKLWRDVSGAEAEDQVEASPPELDLLGEHTVSDAMSRRVCRISPDADVSEAADYMKRAGIHRMFVMEGERLVGIVTTMDIARAVAEHKLYVRRFVFERRRARPSA